MADIVPGQPELIRYGGFAVATDYPNLLTNGTLTDWAGGLPVGWDEILAGDGEVNEVGPGEFDGGAGTGAANIVNSVGFGNRSTLIQNGVTTIANIPYEVYVTYWKNAGSGTGKVQIGTGIDNELTHGSAKYSFGAMTPTGIGNFLVAAEDVTTTANDITFDDMFLRLSTPWTFVQDWDMTSNINAVWLCGETDTERALLQTFGSTAGEVYQVIFNVASLTFDQADTYIEVSVNGGAVDKIWEGGTYTTYLVSGGTASAGVKFKPKLDTLTDTFALTGVSVKHVPSKESTDSETLIVTGGGNVGGAYRVPNGVYRRTTTLQDDKPTWESEEEHSDGAGGTATYYIWWDTDTGSWVIGTSVDTIGAEDWDVVSSIDIPIGLEFTPTGGASSTGTLIPYGGPVTSNRRFPRLRYRYV